MPPDTGACPHCGRVPELEYHDRAACERLELRRENERLRCRAEVAEADLGSARALAASDHWYDTVALIAQGPCTCSAPTDPPEPPDCPSCFARERLRNPVPHKRPDTRGR